MFLPLLAVWELYSATVCITSTSSCHWILYEHFTLGFAGSTSSIIFLLLIVRAVYCYCWQYEQHTNATDNCTTNFTLAKCWQYGQYTLTTAGSTSSILLSLLTVRVIYFANAGHTRSILLLLITIRTLHSSYCWQYEHHTLTADSYTNGALLLLLAVWAVCSCYSWQY